MAAVELPADATDVPPQYKPQPQYDLRAAPIGPKGYKERNKRKLEEYEAQCVEEQAQMVDEVETVRIEFKRPKRDTVGVGKVSGRVWKQPENQRSSMLAASRKTDPWEKKLQQRAQHKAFLDHKREVETARKEKLTAIKKQREAAKARKKENQMKSAIVQKITNPATLKKMMKNKKLKKKLVTIDG